MYWGAGMHGDRSEQEGRGRWGWDMQPMVVHAKALKAYKPLKNFRRRSDSIIFI